MHFLFFNVLYWKLRCTVEFTWSVHPVCKSELGTADTARPGMPKDPTSHPKQRQANGEIRRRHYCLPLQRPLASLSSLELEARSK